MKNVRRLIPMFRQGLQVTLLIGLIICMGVLSQVFGPDTYSFQNGDWDTMQYAPAYNTSEWSIVLDGHSHTIVTDGSLTPEQNIQWHLANGFNAAIVTDHNNLNGALKTRETARSKYNDSIKILLGLEWTSHRIHLNLIGIDNEFIEYFSSRETFPIPPRNPSNKEIQDIITITHRLGGLVSVNHYSRSSFDKPSRDQLKEWGVDFFEVGNDNNYGKSIFDRTSSDFSKEHGLGTITGSDMHDPTEMNVHGWTLIHSSEFTEESIFKQLKNRSTNVLYDDVGVPYSGNHNLNVWSIPILPMKFIGKVFLGFIDFPQVDLIDIMIFFGYVDGSAMAAGVLRQKIQGLGFIDFQRDLSLSSTEGRR